MQIEDYYMANPNVTLRVSGSLRRHLEECTGSNGEYETPSEYLRVPFVAGKAVHQVNSGFLKRYQAKLELFIRRFTILNF